MQAIKAGADGLKWFPTDGASPKMLAAMIAVLPKGVPILAVGGVNLQNMQEWWATGARGFGVGSALWKPHWTRDEVRGSADTFVSAVEIAIGRRTARRQCDDRPQPWPLWAFGAVIAGSLIAASSFGRLARGGLWNRQS